VLTDEPYFQGKDEFLRQARDVEGDRGVGEDAGDQDPLAVEQRHVSP
jgi:hypothetical protein